MTTRPSEPARSNPHTKRRDTRWGMALAATMALWIGCVANADQVGAGPCRIDPAYPEAQSDERHQLLACLRAIGDEIPPSTRAELRSTAQEDMAVEFHMGLGLWLRNEYIHPERSFLNEYFLRRGLDHPDEMSGVALQALRAIERGEALKIDEWIETAKRKRIPVRQKPKEVASS